MYRLTTDSFGHIYENVTVEIGKNQVLRIDKESGSADRVSANLEVTARIIPLASTWEVSLPNNFTINEIGDYSIDLLWSDSLGHPGSCSLLREFSTICKSGYIRQGKGCVKLNKEEDVNIGLAIGAVLSSVMLLLLILLVIIQRDRAVILRCKQRVWRFEKLRISPSMFEYSKKEFPLATIVSGSNTLIEDDDRLRQYIQEKVTWYTKTCERTHARTYARTHARTHACTPHNVMHCTNLLNHITDLLCDSSG